MKLVSVFLIGIVFGLGIAISGMANPAKVLNFFDLAAIADGTWDASLLLVMLSAMFTAMIGYRFVLRRPAPVFESDFSLPTSRVIDAPLMLGSAVFGIGWGIAGFCPGGAVPALGTGRGEPLVFMVAMLAGIFATRTLRNRQAAAGSAA